MRPSSGVCYITYCSIYPGTQAWVYTRQPVSNHAPHPLQRLSSRTPPQLPSREKQPSPTAAGEVAARVRHTQRGDASTSKHDAYAAVPFALRFNRSRPSCASTVPYQEHVPLWHYTNNYSVLICHCLLLLTPRLFPQPSLASLETFSASGGSGYG